MKRDRFQIKCYFYFRQFYQEGTSILEMAIALAVTSVATVGALELLTFVQKEQKNAVYRNARADIAFKIRMIALETANLEGSAETTQRLGTEGIKVAETPDLSLVSNKSLKKILPRFSKTENIAHRSQLLCHSLYGATQGFYGYHR